MRFTVLMACHNRKALTTEAIRRAQAAAGEAAISIDFTVFDDGSTDGTATALSLLHSGINIVAGDGTAFWARGMAVAEASALTGRRQSPDDYLVWLNDDVELDIDALLRMRTAVDENPGAILVGAMRDSDGQTVSYSGLNRQGLHPLRFTKVAPNEAAQRVDTFNGNLVIVPIAAARTLGGIDGYFSHALADIDYGLRAARLGVPVLLAAGTFGVCRANPPVPIRAAREDWKVFRGPKGGGNFTSLRRILRKGHRRSWPAYIAVTYLLWWARRSRTLIMSLARPS